MHQIELVGYLAVIPEEMVPLFEYVETRYEFVEEKRKRMRVEYPMTLTTEIGGRTAVGLGALLYLIREQGLRVKIRNKPPLPHLQVPLWMWEQLRPYQQDCLTDVLGQWAGLVQSPVGSGKTEMEVALALAGMEHSNVLFVAPGLQTLANFVERMQQYHVPKEAFVDYQQLRHLDEFPDSGRIIVGNAAAINNDLIAGNVPHAATIRMLISDEAHHWSCESWNNLLFALHRLERSFGFSATLMQEDTEVYGQDFRHLTPDLAKAIAPCGPMLHAVPIEAVKEYIETPTVMSFPFVWDAKHKVYGISDWRRLSAKVVANTERMQEIARVIGLLADAGRQTLIPVSDKAYGRRIFDAVNLDDCACWFGSGEVHGFDPTLHVTNIKQRILDGRINHVIVTSHLAEGADIPSLNTIFLTEGKKARGVIQRTGRTTRKGGELGSVVVNFFDVGSKVLENQSESRELSIESYYKTDPPLRYPDPESLIADMHEGQIERATGLGQSLGAGARSKRKLKNNDLFF